ncbi:MAG: hypothetical protein IJB85_07990 [Clostridia bacterium]|nr:hypothetical protein [Clostridia bacterium]
MKKAYVKPVFFAEEFVAETSYALTGCGTMSWSPKEMYEDMLICSNDGHKLDHNGNATVMDGVYGQNANGENITYWDYASTVDRTGAGDEEYAASNRYLFNSASSICDFVWDDTSEDIGVWRENTTTNTWSVAWIEKLTTFFIGTNSDLKNHQPQYEGTLIPS